MATRFSPPRFVWDVNDYRGVSWTVALISLVLSISSLLGRLLYRQHSRALNLDDAPACGLLVLVVLCCGLQMGIASRGLGLTIENMRPQDLSFVSTGLFVTFILYFVATGCSKLSLALTCKITVFDDKRKRSRYFWTLPGAIALVVLLGIIGTAAPFRPEELHMAGAGQFLSLRTIFTVFLTLDALVDLCTVGLMGYEISQLQIQARSRNRIMSILLPRFTAIPVSVFLCRSITPQRLADDFTLRIWRTAALLSLSLLISSVSTAIIAMGRSLEGFDIRAQTDFAMSALGSSKSPGRTKFSQTNSVMASGAYDRTTKVDTGDASSDQMPILPEDLNREGVILVSRTVEHSTERAN